MKRIALLCSLLLAMAISAIAAPPDNQRTKKVPLDISGIMDGRFVFDVVTWEPLVFDTIGDVAGTLRGYLGFSKLHTKHRPDSDGTLPDGEFTIVAANGDEIRGNYAGTAYYASADQAYGNALFVISGGTGRFEGATGTINASFVETFDDPSWESAKVTWALIGAVDY